jgi:dolichol kinase
MFRVTKVKPFSGVLDTCFDSFKDSQDPGALTMTHMYLLIACALPLWMLPRGSKVSLSTCSGVIAVGFGDTAASVIGSFGRFHWTRSKKTVEGSIGAAVSMFLSSVFLFSYLDPSQMISLPEMAVLFLISFLVSAIEAKTKEIDNLVLPIYHNILILTAKTYFHRL